MKKELCKAAQMMGNPLGLVCENFENEGFEEGNSSSSGNVISQIWKIIQFIIFMFALYKAFKCGGKFLDVLAACCCSPCYIAYVYGALGGCVS